MEEQSMSEKELSQANAETPEETSTAAAHTTSAFQLSVRDDNIAVITIDVVGDSMNTLKAEFAGQFRAAMQQVKSQPAIQGLVLISGKKDSFIAGADVSMLAACENEADAEALSKEGHRLFAELEQMPIPVVAAIHGPCLGGGLELAMAAHSRVCTDHPKTVLGLPEVQLGLLPGSGGTQRLPRLVGIAKSLDMMLTGKQLRAKQALKAGLVDDVVPASILLEAAVKLALKGKPGPRQPRLNMVGKLLESNPVGRHILFDQALKQTRAKTRGNYPAPEMILECVRTGVSEGASGFDLEARRFAQLVMSPESEQLRNIFFATTEMKKETGADGVEPARVRKALVLGGGLMGGGISYVTATKAGLPVRVKDIAHQGISHALKYSFDLLNKKVKRRFMRRSEMQKQLSLISGTTDYVGVHDADMVVEAVFEDLKVKQQMVRDVEANCGEHTIFASNTSSLPIHQIAEAAERPQNVIGLHYFSPVDKMPLVEVIAHDKTSPETIATTVAFARKQGKTPIVVKDGAGFYVNRILALYMNEAANLLLEGEPVDSIDRALKDFGFPVGPFNLLDEVGIDVGSKIGPILQAELGERFAAPAAFDKLLADGRKGRKSNKGFYLYQDSSPLKRIPLLKGKAKKPVDESVYRVLGVSPTGTTAAPELAQRCAVQMLNEAVRCLEEGIIRSPRDGDIGAIFGIGFPPFLGGPFHYIDTLGAAKLVTILEGYQKRFGERYAPAQRLLEMTDSGERFYPKR